MPMIVDKIFRGAAIGDNGSGLARPLQAGDPFEGFALVDTDNSNGSAGSIRVHHKRKGRVELPITGVSAQTDHGTAVFAVDDDTFTLSSTSNSLIGVIVEYVSGTTAVVYFDADATKLAAAAAA